jgi:hypothetical protein
MARLEGSWERQSYLTSPLPDGDPTQFLRHDRRRASLAFGDWASGSMRWEAGGSLDRWDEDNHLSVEGALEVRLAGDRVALGLETAAWTPLQAGARFVTNGLYGAWRWAPEEDAIHQWEVSGGVTSASRGAPLDLWPGAGTGQARAPLLRAHPLLSDGIVTGEVFGRHVAHASLEYQRSLQVPVARLRLAAFADTARAWRTTGSESPSPLHIDLGVGFRVSARGLGGTVRVDVARGMRDGNVILSAGWQPAWPRR